MKSKILPFWEMNVNAITMLPSIVILRRQLTSEEKSKPNFISEVTEDFVEYKEAKAILGFGAKKIKAYVLRFGCEVKKSPLGTVYKRTTIEEIKKIVRTENELKQANREDYINNQDLMNLFGFTGYKAWDIAKKENLKKIKISRNVVYYEREIAIAAFSKYKK